MDFVPSPEKFIEQFVHWYDNNIADYDVPEIEYSEVFVVWFTYILGRAKCLISTARLDHMYYELTYDLDKNQIYVDSYKKVRNDSITF